MIGAGENCSLFCDLMIITIFCSFPSACMQWHWNQEHSGGPPPAPNNNNNNNNMKSTNKDLRRRTLPCYYYWQSLPVRQYITTFQMISTLVQVKIAHCFVISRSSPFSVLSLLHACSGIETNSTQEAPPPPPPPPEVHVSRRPKLHTAKRD